MRFWIRAEASPEIGYGHALRCIGLAEQLMADGHEVDITSAYWPYEVQNKFPQGATCGIGCSSWVADIEVIDSYTLKPVSRKAINIGNQPWWFLRKELLQYKPRLRTALKTLGISAGGHNSGPGTLENYGDYELSVLTPNFHDYGAFLDASDVIVGAFGVSAWERAYFGIPSLGYVKAENQHGNTVALTRDLMAFCIGVGEPDIDVLRSSIELLYRNPELVRLMSEKCMFHVKHDSYSQFWDLLKGKMD